MAHTLEDKVEYFKNKIINNELTKEQFEANAIKKISSAQMLNDVETETKIVCEVMKELNQCNGCKGKSCKQCATYTASETMLANYKGMPTLRQIQNKFNCLFNKE